MTKSFPIRLNLGNAMDKAIVVILITMCVTSTLSLNLHTPERLPISDNWGFSYSDIVYGVFNPIFRDIVSYNGILQSDKIQQRWFNHALAIRLATSERICPLPYKDYKFEYPPIVGALWIISTCIPMMMILPERYTVLEYLELSRKIVEAHYYIHSAVLITFFVLSIIYMYKISIKLNISWKRVLLFTILPSTILYLIYNWDIIAVAFMIMAIYYMLDKRYLLSGLMLGLSISTKLLPIVFTSIVVYDMIQKARANNIYKTHLKHMVLGVIATGLAPYVGVLALSYEGFTYFLNHHAQWYCENCIYSLITQDIWSPYNRAYSMMFVLISSLILLAVDVDYNNRQLMEVALVSMIIATALNYVFSPQMMLLITSLAVLALDLRPLVFLVIADASNFGIMALFFKDADARAWLVRNIGIRMDIKYSPHTPDSPVQMIASVRNIILILIMIDIIYRLLKLQKELKT